MELLLNLEEKLSGNGWRSGSQMTLVNPQRRKKDQKQPAAARSPWDKSFALLLPPWWLSSGLLVDTQDKAACQFRIGSFPAPSLFATLPLPSSITPDLIPAPANFFQLQSLFGFQSLPQFTHSLPPFFFPSPDLPSCRCIILLENGNKTRKKKFGSSCLCNREKLIMIISLHTSFTKEMTFWVKNAGFPLGSGGSNLLKTLSQLSCLVKAGQTHTWPALYSHEHGEQIPTSVFSGPSTAGQGMPAEHFCAALMHRQARIPPLLESQPLIHPPPKLKSYFKTKHLIFSH